MLIFVDMQQLHRSWTNNKILHHLDCSLVQQHPLPLQDRRPSGKTQNFLVMLCLRLQHLRRKGRETRSKSLNQARLLHQHHRCHADPARMCLQLQQPLNFLKLYNGLIDLMVTRLLRGHNRPRQHHRNLHNNKYNSRTPWFHFNPYHHNNYHSFLQHNQHHMVPQEPQMDTKNLHILWMKNYGIVLIYLILFVFGNSSE